MDDMLVAFAVSVVGAAIDGAIGTTVGNIISDYIIRKILNRKQ